ncbi:hypothetical protein [uncultured Methanobrevibacter sp.]|uniref:hypothetical protein n=1 Tax=uncultured Methanobrevibacter sp. TaxID=253161 RepID=UPI002615E672|nr:hypothetical protein [uncultured Methanobrevibacter sp.]
MGLFSTSIFVIKGIESLNYIQSQISSYTDTITTYNNYLSNYDFSGSYDSISQMTLNSLNQIYTIGLIEVIILVIVAILAIH